jgi:hypothetical protein
MELILEPTVQRSRVKPYGNRIDVSTKRESSLFEVVEGRKCFNCHRVEHNSRTCPQKSQ